MFINLLSTQKWLENQSAIPPLISRTSHLPRGRCGEPTILPIVDHLLKGNHGGSTFFCQVNYRTRYDKIKIDEASSIARKSSPNLSQSHGVRIGLEDTGLFPGLSVDDADGGSTSDGRIVEWWCWQTSWEWHMMKNDHIFWVMSIPSPSIPIPIFVGYLWNNEHHQLIFWPLQPPTRCKIMASDIHWFLLPHEEMFLEAPKPCELSK